MDIDEITISQASSNTLSEPSANADNVSSYYEIVPQTESDIIKSSKLYLSWKNIFYHVRIKNKGQIILKGVSGYASPGELTVLMGSSGAGKTTLLNIIAGRVKCSPNSKVTGEVMINNISLNTSKFTKKCAYVTQEDILLPYLTVKESLTFAAGLTFCGSFSTINKKVTEIMEKLRLSHISDNLIGSVTVKGISGGERKRVSIGMELISDPQIIILDEPTSGLDSFTAEVLIDVLLDLAKDGKTVISTLHQPSSSIFNKIHKLVLLSNGFIIYDGPASKSRKYFAKIGFSCPKLTNPADYYMNFLHIVDRLNMKEEEIFVLETLKSAYKASDLEINENLENKLIKNEGYKGVNSIKKFVILCERGFINSRRNPGASQAWISLLIVVWVLTDLLFHDLGNNFNSIQNINGVLFFITIVAVMNGNSSSSMGIPCERPIYLKEYSQGVYGTFTYMAAKIASELPLQVLAAIVTSAMVYFPIGLYNQAGNFFVFFAVFLLSYLMGSGLGHIIGALCKSEELAFGLSQIFIAPLIIYGGLIVNINRLNSFFSWIRYITPYFYAFGALSVNQYKDMEFNCDPDGPECNPLDELGFNSEIQVYIMPTIWYAIITRCIAYLILKLLGMRIK